MARDSYQHPGIGELSVAGVLHALSNPVRLTIVRSLSRVREAAWTDFVVDIAPSTLSHHMRVLREAGITTNRRDGSRCLVSLRSDLSTRFPGLLETVLRLVSEDA